MFKIIVKTFIFILLISLPFVFAQDQDKVFHIFIDGTIDLGLAPYVERVINEAEAEGAKAVVLEVNTFGGRLDAAVQIRDALLNTDLLTIAFINKRAISAGALISLACQKIIMTSGSSIGAATAVDGAGNKASEKVISYFRSEMRSTARHHGRDGKIAEGMVDEDVEIPDISEKGKLITLTNEEALKLNIADSTAENLKEMLEQFDLDKAEIIKREETWAEDIVRFLTSPFVSSMLASIGFLGLMYEVMTAGWGVGGTIGSIALALFLWGHYIVNLADAVDILILLAGVILLFIEVFFIPGFGFFGVTGIVLIVTGMFMSLIGHWPTVDTGDIWTALYQLSFAFIVTFVVSIVMFKFVPKTGVWRKIALDTETKKEEGYIGTITNKEYLIDRTGKTMTPLHPSGTVIIGDERLDVVSEGGFIPKDTQVKVIKIEGNRIIVRQMQSS